jgi:ABC-type oligopeptide transport system ATPase subunit
MTIIGLVGRAGSGKDTTAVTIAQLLEPGLDSLGLPNHPVTCYQFRFAETLKRHVAQVFDWNEDRIDGANKELPDPRYERSRAINLMMEADAHLLREWRSHYGYNFSDRHIDDFLETKRAEGRYGPSYLTSRFAQQRVGTEGYRWLWDRIWVDLLLRQVRKLPGDSIAVVTDVRFHNEAEAIRAEGGIIWRIVRASKIPADHVSESEMETIDTDFIVDNSGSLEDLRVQVEVGLKDLLNMRDPVTGRYEPEFDTTTDPNAEVIRLESSDLPEEP